MKVKHFFLAALLSAAAAIAQVGGTGTIQGTVTDPSGGVVTRASVTATNVATGVETTRKTSEAGEIGRASCRERV